MITPEMLASVIVASLVLVGWVAICVRLATALRPPEERPPDDEDWGD